MCAVYGYQFWGCPSMFAFRFAMFDDVGVTGCLHFIDFLSFEGCVTMLMYIQLVYEHAATVNGTGYVTSWCVDSLRTCEMQWVHVV